MPTLSYIRICKKKRKKNSERQGKLPKRPRRRATAEAAGGEWRREEPRGPHEKGTEVWIGASPAAKTPPPPCIFSTQPLTSLPVGSLTHSLPPSPLSIYSFVSLPFYATSQIERRRRRRCNYYSKDLLFTSFGHGGRVVGWRIGVRSD